MTVNRANEAAILLSFIAQLLTLIVYIKLYFYHNPVCSNMHLFNLFVTFTATDILFIVDILNHKLIKNVIIQQCNNYNIPEMHKIFAKSKIMVTNSLINDQYYFEHKSHQHQAIVINTACEDWITTALKNSSTTFQGYTFVIITENLPETADILSQYPIEVDSDVTIASKMNDSFELYEVYNTGFYFNGTYNVVKIGTWDSGLCVVPRDRKNLQRVFVKTAVIILQGDNLGHQTMEQYMEKLQINVDTVHRMKYFYLMKYMRDMYNISYDMHRVSTWGYQRNGSFDGMVGALYQGLADIGGAPVFYRIDRQEHVQYISEVWMSRHYFIFRHPKYPGGFYTIYTRPLSNTVWYCVILLVVILAVVLWAMLVVQNRDYEDSSFSLAGLYILGAICQQEMVLLRSKTSVQILTFITFVFAVTLYQYYNATIVSSLLLEPPRNIRTLQNLLDSDLKAGAHDIVYDKDYFKRTTDNVAIKLYHKKIATPTQYNFFSPERGIALVKKGGFAFHIDTTVAFPIIKATFSEREICETYLVQMYPLQRMGVVIRRTAPYKEHIAYAIRRMYEAGLPNRIQAVVDVPMPECAHTPDSSIFSVTIREFSMPLLVLTFGVLSSMIVLAAEIVVSTVRRKKLRLTCLKSK